MTDRGRTRYSCPWGSSQSASWALVPKISLPTVSEELAEVHVNKSRAGGGETNLQKAQREGPLLCFVVLLVRGRNDKSQVEGCGRLQREDHGALVK